MYRCTLPRQAGWVLFHRLLQSLRCAHTRPSPAQGLPHGKGCSKHLWPRFTHAAGASLPQSVCADKPVATREAVWHMQRDPNSPTRVVCWRRAVCVTHLIEEQCFDSS